jgi:hypothetical protein
LNIKTLPKLQIVNEYHSFFAVSKNNDTYSIKRKVKPPEKAVSISVGTANQKLKDRSAAEGEQQRGLRIAINIRWNFKLQERIYCVIFTFKNIQCQEKCINVHFNSYLQ